MILKNVTLQEANGLLPLVREQFFRIHIMLAELQQFRAKLSRKTRKRYVIDKHAESIVVVKKRGYGKKFKANCQAAKELEIKIEEVVNDLMRLGVVIKTLMPPHIDFLSVRNNEPIFLCWHGGECEIGHWHYLDDGPPFRQVIAHKARFGPHMVH
jgi:hypothetical protein